MLDFGARLSLKDNMSATLRKNLKIQQEFSQQVKEVNRNVQDLGKRKANPVIKLRDEVTGRLIGVRRELRAMSDVRAMSRIQVEDEATRKADEITKKIKEIGKMVASPFIKLKEDVTAKSEKIKQKLKQIATTYTPSVKIRDLASQGLSKVKNTLNWLKVATVTPLIMVKDKATAQINKVRVALKTVGKLVTRPLISLKDKASPAINKLKSGLKAVGKTVAKPLISIKDEATKVLENVKSGLKAVGNTTAKAMVAIKDGATTGIKKIGSMIKTLAKGVTVGVAVVGAGASLLLGKGAMLEQQQISVEHFIGVNNKGASETDVKKMADSYIKTLRDNANATPFTTDEVISAGTRSLNVSGGNTDDAMKLLKVAEDMASLNPEKSLSDAIEAIADMKNGETERMKEFGFKISQEDIKKAGGAMNIIEDQLAPYFEGGATKLATSGSGLLSTIKGKIGSALTDTGLAMIEKAKPLLEKVVALVDTMAPKMQAVGEIIATGFGKGVEWVSKLVDNAGGLSTVFEPFTNLFSAIGSNMAILTEGVGANFSSLIPAISSAVSSIVPIIQSFSTHFQNLLPVLVPIIQDIAGIIGNCFPIVQEIIVQVLDAVMPKVQGIAKLVQKVVPIIGSIIEGVLSAISTIFPVAWNIISPIIDIAMSVFELLLGVVKKVFPVIKSIIQSVWKFLEPIFTALGKGLSKLSDGAGKLVGWLGDKLGLNEGSSNAYGKGRVPYDGYPAILHQGEKVLTRTQADQYSRQMSTRGVNLSKVIETVPTNGHTTVVQPVEKTTGVRDTSVGGNSIQIEKLADQIVVREDADVDKIVNTLVKRLKEVEQNVA